MPVFRVLAACLAFIPAMLFGVAAVNKYYGYYQTWGAAAADIGGQGLNTVPAGPRDVPAQRLVTVMNAVGRDLAVVVNQGVKENKFKAGEAVAEAVAAGE